MSAKFRDKNLLFYRKNNQESIDFLNELGKNEPLKSQFILVNQDDSRLTLPLKIRDIEESLILIAHGVNEPIIGKEAVYWLKNNGFASKGNGLEYCALGKEQLGAFIDEGHGMSGCSKFSLIGEKQQDINTFEDSGRGVKSNEFDQRLTRLKNDRNDLSRGQRGQKPLTF